jgi:hypothetical protein
MITYSGSVRPGNKTEKEIKGPVWQSCFYRTHHTIALMNVVYFSKIYYYTKVPGFVLCSAEAPLSFAYYDRHVGNIDYER